MSAPPLTLHLLDLPPAAARAQAHLNRLEPSARDAFALAAQTEGSRLGLRRGPDDIPLIASPLSAPREELRALGEAAHKLVSGLVAVCRDLLASRPERAELLFHHLSPLEREALRTRAREAEDLLIARVDWFVRKDHAPRALEINATIPAMPVYSDAAAKAFLRASAPERAEALWSRSPSNADWLLDALLRAARAAGRVEPLQVQILHREGDPQRTELLALCELLEARGVAARTCTPDDVVLDGAPQRVLYRHLFARHVELDSPLGRAFLDPVRHGMWNRVDGWLETKALLAELSLAAHEGHACLSAEERQAATTLLPWTRLLDDVSDVQLGDGSAYVLKRSHDYGGKSVLIGREAGAAGFAAALAKARTEGAGTWIVQELVDSPALDRWIWSAKEGRAVHLPLHLDISTYASLIPGVPPGGSVCRGAPGHVVNIVTGGGVAPLLPDDVLSDAVELWAR